LLLARLLLQKRELLCLFLAKSPKSPGLSLIEHNVALRDIALNAFLKEKILLKV
jgi:hypothetical protein